jgi:wobble nucleotide-excising tRNase
VKLEQIQSIKYIRNFLDFNGEGVLLHSKKNKDGDFEDYHKTIIYAPNGSGKTNLSRLFKYISSSENNIDELLSHEAEQTSSKSDFSICVDGKIINQSNYSLDENQKILGDLCIFNSDYIEENIKCVNFSEKDIDGTILIPVGKENIKIQSLELDIEQKTKNREKICETLSETLTTAKTKLKKNDYKGKDLSIWQEFSLINIMSEEFEVTPPINKNEFSSCEDQFKKVKGFRISDKMVSQLTEISVNQINELNDISTILKEEKKFSKFDEETESNIANITTNWIQQSLLKEGIEKSEAVNKCLLCNRAIDNSVKELFNSYKNYFKDEKGIFESKVDQFKKDLQLLKTNLQKVNNNLQSKTEEYIEIFSLKNKWEDLTTESMIEKIESLEKLLDSKKQNPEECPILNIDTSKEIKELNVKIKKNNDLIFDVNKKIDNSSHRETELRKMIGQKHLYNFYMDNKSDFDEVNKLGKIIEDNKSELKIEKDKLPKTDALSNIVNLFNKFLHNYLDLHKYKAEILNGTISLRLNDVDISKETRKISEGEKTMIGFCYFLASSIQKFDSPERYNNSVFMIDDPICSTSYGNFFGICNLLEEYENKIYTELWKGEEKPKIQKIVLTHNTQFFNMLRGNIFKESALYFILNEKTIKIISNRKLISEFETALQRIYEASVDDKYEGNIGNDMRRFFETVRHFYGLHQFEAESIRTIFTNFDVDKYKAFYSAINYYSHGNPEASTDPLPPESTSKLLEEFVILIKESQFKELWKKIEKLVGNNE